MWVSRGAFLRGLHDEHVSESSFLYEHVTRLRSNPTLPFTTAIDFETRLVAHLDGLVLGGDAAQQRLDATFDPDESGHWYVAGVLACMQGDARRYRELLARAQALDCRGAAEPLGDALRHVMPAAWSDDVTRWLLELREPWLGRIAEAASIRGVHCAEHLVTRLHDADKPSPAFVVALGAAGATGAEGWLEAQVVGAASPTIKRAALTALGWLGSPRALALAARSLEETPAAHVAFALMASREAALPLVSRLSRELHDDTVTALALLGDLRAVRPLIDALTRSTNAEHIAWALDCITGAGLTTTVVVPDPDAPDDDHVAEGSRRLAPPGRRRPLQVARRRLGDAETRMDTDPAAWNEWLDGVRSKFDANLRYRFGIPTSASSLIATLADPARREKYRSLAALELAIRYRAPRFIDTRAPVGRQRLSVQRVATWAQQTFDGLPPGRWWYAGAVM